jgi:HSP20 family protein
MEEMIEEMNRAFNTHLPGLRSAARPTAFLPGRAARMYPLININEDHDNFYVDALAPGIDPKKIDISVVRNRLTISGEKKGLDVNQECIHRSERSAGRFVRTVELPMDVSSSGISARYKNGILTIIMPKSEEAKPRQISVEIA